MQLRYGIPLMFAIMAGATWLSGPAGFNVYFMVVAATAAWIFFDASRLEIHRYQTQLAMPRLILALLSLLVWPLIFPWYLSARYRIRNGLIAPGPESRWFLKAVAVVFALAIAGGALAFVATRELRYGLEPTAAAATAHATVPVKVTLTSGGDMILTVNQSPGASVPTEQEALDLATVSFMAYTGTARIQQLTVIYMQTERRGAVTTSRQLARYAFDMSSLAANVDR